MIILADTRQQKDLYITKKFDKNKVKWIRTKLDSADYMAIRYKNGKPYKDYTTLIDTKKDLLELSANLCRTSEHARIIREIELAKELGCKHFIFLIKENKIKTPTDIKAWSNPHTKIKGTTLYKIMVTMQNKYGVNFIIKPRKEMGDTVIDLLNANNEFTMGKKEGE